jgi:hypothetical protein
MKYVTPHLPAFPTGSWEYDGQGNVLPYQEPGMSLRDYFAARAMQGLISNANPDDGFNMTGISNWAYNMADAMLKAREK